MEPFLSVDDAPYWATTASELIARVTRIEQQILAQYTAMAAYSTAAQQAIDFARAEARSDIDRCRRIVVGLLDTLRGDVGARLERLDDRCPQHPALPVDTSARQIALLEVKVDSMLTVLQGCVDNCSKLRRDIDTVARRHADDEGWTMTMSGDPQRVVRPSL